MAVLRNALRHRPVQGQCHEIRGRHARQLQVRMGLEAKSCVVRGFAQQHTACRVLRPQFCQRLLYQACTDTLPLPCRQPGSFP